MDVEDASRMEYRFQRNTYLVIVLALGAAIYWSGLRMAMGVLLGGALCLFNIRWLRGSVSGILSYAAAEQTGRVPSWTASKFILRYLIVGVVIAAAVWSGDFHPLGIGIGFAAFVGSVMIEAGYQIYRFLAGKEQIPEE
ncbi:MAG: ATP synthase subunit I [Acidobacteria bacterium]|nr:ATP synthase subunit I [Acidobacteriota bacterium]